MSGTSDGAEKGWEARRANIAIRNEQLRAEIERLTALANSYSAQISSEQAENERLRAALREIANDPVGISIVQAEIARAALTGEQP